MQIVLRPGALVKGSVVQAYPLLAGWTAHVLANACGLTCSTHWIGLDDVKVLAPLHIDKAQALLRQWLALYHSAWDEPMAVPGRTAFEWLATLLAPGKETDPVKRQKKAHAEARNSFMGSKQSPREAERLSVHMMRRHAREYAEVKAGIEHWASALYRDLIVALPPVSDEATSLATQQAKGDADA
jgi:exonuclease V gamma subunit